MQEMSSKIKLTKGKYAIVDKEDYDFLNQWKWFISTKGYAVRVKWIGHGHKNRKAKRFYMHGIVNKTPVGFQTDHINHNKLDNRKENLRTVTNQTNHFNMKKSVRNKSGYTGVYWFKRDKNWHAQITRDGKRIHLGYFNNLIDAVFAREKAKKIYHAI